MFPSLKSALGRRVMCAALLVVALLCAVHATLGAVAALALYLALLALNAGFIRPTVLLGVNNPTIVGDNTVIWGTGGIYSGTGIITDAEVGDSSDKMEIQDENGFTVAVIYFNQKNECQFNMIVKTSMPTLEIGDLISIGGVANCQVENIRRMWKQNDVAKYAITAVRYSGLTPAS